MPSLKRIGKSVICAILEMQVKSLRRAHQFKVIAVAGSVGKTSTKLAITETLAASHSVRSQRGNYNDRIAIPLVLFGHGMPGLFNVAAWLKIFWVNHKIIHGSYLYEYVVVELGTDRPGHMAAFDYLQPDISVITSIVPEHMAYFGTLEAVAAEELNVLKYSKQTLINTDDTPAKFLADKRFVSYGLGKKADYRVVKWRQFELQDGDMTIALPDGAELETASSIVGVPGVKSY